LEEISRLNGDLGCERLERINELFRRFDVPMPRRCMFTDKKFKIFGDERIPQRNQQIRLQGRQQFFVLRF
jgi:hypothetical protein